MSYYTKYQTEKNLRKFPSRCDDIPGKEILNTLKTTFICLKYDEKSDN